VAQFAKITALNAKLGRIFRMITRDPKPIVGAKTGLLPFAIAINFCSFHWRFGRGAIRVLRKDLLV
jgi:hypothetical protein